ncbi:S1 RNA-binding domain-containing protein [Emticicia sp. 21SJ11W-3]|uniref:CvfB family protein n=1 Tax=Emticicia sp. 21SJ11W-3 TaxID=2916755 RepID=UPI00209FEAF9|nr:S1-like domain-containing RNA-binding protein [Emticicia sp. 21SJ11W-3]UTA67157.1 S1-like domain-containing RNA-binding protein [Emticicia sp. 21SJ11W-3]
MLNLGVKNTLRILRGTSVGMYLGDKDGNDVLLPKKYIPDDVIVGDDIEVFIYKDSEDRIIATTLEPKVKLNEFAYLQVMAVTGIGAFLDWGLEKDLFVPFKEQNRKLEVGDWSAVYVYLDEDTERLVGSCKVNRFFEKENIELEEGQEVDLLVFEETNLGLNVVIDQKYKGLIYENEVFQRIKLGSKVKGFIKQLREDSRIDVSLQKQGYANVEPNAERILEKLKASDGFLDLTDKSDANYVMYQLEMSKKTFKKAIGSLYKQRLIRIEEDGIYLV